MCRHPLPRQTLSLHLQIVIDPDDLVDHPHALCSPRHQPPLSASPEAQPKDLLLPGTIPLHPPFSLAAWKRTSSLQARAISQHYTGPCPISSAATVSPVRSRVPFRQLKTRTCLLSPNVYPLDRSQNIRVHVFTCGSLLAPADLPLMRRRAHRPRLTAPVQSANCLGQPRVRHRRGTVPAATPPAGGRGPSPRLMTTELTTTTPPAREPSLHSLGPHAVLVDMAHAPSTFPRPAKYLQAQLTQ